MVPGKANPALTWCEHGDIYKSQGVSQGNGTLLRSTHSDGESQHGLLCSANVSILAFKWSGSGVEPMAVRAVGGALGVLCVLRHDSKRSFGTSLCLRAVDIFYVPRKLQRHRKDRTRTVEVTVHWNL